MITWHEELQFDFSNPTINRIFTEDTLFFDIETTGFSPEQSTLYLIGCAARKKDTLIINQFFAETQAQQAEILAAFVSFLPCYDTLITFNGQGFDIPYLKAKCHSLLPEISDPFGQKHSIDIFKTVSRLKTLLNLPNGKQKTAEQFLGISREDAYHGGELIAVYHGYVKTHSQKLASLLRLHNYEDVLHMPYLLPIFSYHALAEGNFSLCTVAATENDSPLSTAAAKRLCFTLHLPEPIPQPISYTYGDFCLTAEQNTARIQIRLFEGELKYFFGNPPDYYYLPAEDVAIHKSIASSVAKEHRKKATAATCYTKKYGIFLPQIKEIQSPAFQHTKKDKKTYFELTEEFIVSETIQKQYLQHILEYLLSQKNNSDKP